MSDVEYAIQAAGLLGSVDLAVPRGAVFGLVGGQEAGGALRIFAGLRRPARGWAQVGGYDVVRYADRVRELTGAPIRYAAIDEKLTGLERLLLVGRLLQFDAEQARHRAACLLARLDLMDAAHEPVCGYPAALRQRLDLAAALMNRPQVLLLDDPLAGLDAAARADLGAWVREVATRGLTVLFTARARVDAGQAGLLDHEIVTAGALPDK
ncbi:ATP-binding cassette domain-containing protein [Micromonospora sp. CPCC 205371]|nr:ATP-binding cassette domain-containing protein [Micromonospora sp. CPCC 205371]